MTRLLFPQDRLAYSVSSNGPLYPVPSGATLTVYVDQSATTLANIVTYPGLSAITGSVLVMGDDTLVPQFMGPNDGSVELWAKPQGTASTYQMAADIEARIVTIESSAGITLSAADARYARPFVHVQDVPGTEWIVHHNLGYFPSVSLVDTSGDVITSDIVYVDANTLRVELVYSVGGKAYCS